MRLKKFHLKYDVTSFFHLLKKVVQHFFFHIIKKKFHLKNWKNNKNGKRTKKKYKKGTQTTKQTSTTNRRTTTTETHTYIHTHSLTKREDFLNTVFTYIFYIRFTLFFFSFFPPSFSPISLHIHTIFLFHIFFHAHILSLIYTLIFSHTY